LILSDFELMELNFLLIFSFPFPRKGFDNLIFKSFSITLFVHGTLKLH
jgi:hypothetical protein